MKVSVPSKSFDAGFYRRYYVDPRTRVSSRADALKLGRFFCAYTAYLGFTVKRVLDAGCGLGHLRVPVREIFPRAIGLGDPHQRMIGELGALDRQFLEHGVGIAARLRRSRQPVKAHK